MNPSGFYVDPKYKIPQIVTLTHYEDKMRTFLKIRKPQMLIF